MRVRVGNKISHYELIENGVSQGAVISPILFNIMVSDFIENERNKSLLFSDYVTIFAQVHKGTGHK
jgi:retron-type reverse transcriptase